MAQKTRYLVDEKGTRTAVVLDLDAYRRLLEQIEELEDLRAFDGAKQSGEKAISLAEALAVMNRKRSTRRARSARQSP
jgi:hypothetical protein